MTQAYKILRKVGVLLVGVPLLIIGIILLPLPGPGMLVIFLALFILSLEFAFVKPYRERIEKEVKGLTAKLKDRSDKMQPKDK